MEDLIISIPSSDVTFVAQLMEKMGYYVKTRKYQGDTSHTFRQIFDRTSAANEHDWTLEEINAEIAAARRQTTTSRAVCM